MCNRFASWIANIFPVFLTPVSNNFCKVKCLFQMSWDLARNSELYQGYLFPLHKNFSLAESFCVDQIQSSLLSFFLCSSLPHLLFSGGAAWGRSGWVKVEGCWRAEEKGTTEKTWEEKGSGCIDYKTRCSCPPLIFPVQTILLLIKKIMFALFLSFWISYYGENILTTFFSQLQKLNCSLISGLLRKRQFWVPGSYLLKKSI